ncbi:hypothetical protein L484_025891 [Morus notabilis]|uniref:Uncharacterized protein n=1 Tax=Morus notabilis TaxID=981085 RepID=W9RAU5_9ROSA|nr:hypothetical protein L484_025891 [Morus notabilis]
MPRLKAWPWKITPSVSRPTKYEPPVQNPNEKKVKDHTLHLAADQVQAAVPLMTRKWKITPSVSPLTQATSPKPPPERPAPSHRRHWNDRPGSATATTNDPATHPRGSPRSTPPWSQNPRQFAPRKAAVLVAKPMAIFLRSAHVSVVPRSASAVVVGLFAAAVSEVGLDM